MIEVDGPVHLLKKEYDKNRDIVIKGWGFDILRFTNNEVERDLDGIVSKIEAYINSK